MSYENENRNNEYSSTQNTNQSYNGYTQSTGQPYGDWQNGGQAYNEAQNAGQPYSGNGNKKKPHKNTWPKKIAGVCACAVLFGAVAGVTFQGVSRIGGSKTTETTASTATATTLSVVQPTASNSESASAQSLDVSSIAQSVMPSMVSITNVSVQEVQNYFSYYFGGGQTQTQEVTSAGSGIIIGENDTELLIVTNNHVVADAETLSVCFIDNQVYEAHIKGTDSDNDLAVVAVNKSDISSDTLSQIAIAQIGDSDSLQVGEQVVAIGNALGYGQSVTTGIVSAMNRQIDTTDAELIQTDAAINPGNSGGALLNMQGQVIGINEAKFSSTEVEGMGYAISMNVAKPIVEELMNRETREKVTEDQASYLGIYGEDVTDAVESSYGIPKGIYVSSLVENGPAAQAGLPTGCVITKFDGTTVSTMSELKEQFSYYAAGETVEITIQVSQNGQYEEQTVSVTLGAAADAETSQSQTQNQGSQNQSQDSQGQDQQFGMPFGFGR